MLDCEIGGNWKGISDVIVPAVNGGGYAQDSGLDRRYRFPDRLARRVWGLRSDFLTATPRVGLR